MRAADPHLATATLPAGIIGFSLSGFFDGILLHQVLQWHHLLSLVPGEALRDIRTQILADGLFHVLMYAIATWGLVLLWRRRDDLRAPGAARRVAGGALLGFGLWNVVDVVGFHWLLGIHRIRVGVPDPMTYDLAWLALFAVPFLIAGWRVLRAAPGGSGGGRAAAAGLAVLAVAGGTVATLPPPGGARTALAVFPAGRPAQAFAAVAAIDGRVIWTDRSGGLMAVRLARADDAGRLYAGGALLVSRSPALAGCLAWTTVV
jgi:uncharacterized membrane protein